MAIDIKLNLAKLRSFFYKLCGVLVGEKLDNIGIPIGLIGLL